MKLVAVNIRNFRAIENLSLSFTDSLGTIRPVTVIAGPNGCGKTSVLHAITQALRGVMGYRTADVPIPTRDDVRASAPATGGWTSQPPEVQVDVRLTFDEDEQACIEELLALVNMKSPPNLTNNQLAVHWKYPPGFDEDGKRLGWWTASIEPALPYVRSWLQARKLAIRAWTRKEPGMRYELLTRIGGLLFFPQDRNLRERVLGEEGVGPSLPSDGTGNTDGDDDAGTERPRFRERAIAEILHFLSDYAKHRVPPLPDEQNWERRIQRLFHEICAPSKYVGYLYREDDQRGAPVLQDGGGQYPLSHAASGEQVILEYITRLTYPSPLNRGIILIDEPEIHLHPAWIRKLYLALPNIGQDNQFILTTHSAELFRRAAADNALIELGTLGVEQ